MKTHSAELVAAVNEKQSPVIITQNGEPRAVVMDVVSYERMQDTLALLKLIAQSEDARRKKRWLTHEQMEGGVEQKAPKLSKLPVHWLEPASLHLVEIIDYILRDRRDAARKLGRQLLIAEKRLSRNPRRGKLVPELRDQGISEYHQIFVGVYRRTRSP